jgi:hypothetical protein
VADSAEEENDHQPQGTTKAMNRKRELPNSLERLAPIAALFSEFQTFAWTDCPSRVPKDLQGCVYALFLTRGELCVPFYVGQTENLLRRAGDYEYKDFTACTDFKVGVAIQYLTRRHGCKIELLAKESASRKDDEKYLIRS